MSCGTVAGVRFLFLVAALLAILKEGLSAKQDDSDGVMYDYLIIIDGGSTGSRIHVHKYLHTQSAPIPELFPSETIKVKPGMLLFSFM